ncbi:MAG: acyl-CoA dehydrogenase family protein, partial [Pseudolabrys sp.]
MDFALTEDQVQMRDAVRRMVERDIKPILKKNRRDVALPKEEMLKIFAHVAEYGLLAPRLPEAAGGPGISMLDF